MVPAQGEAGKEEDLPGREEEQVVAIDAPGRERFARKELVHGPEAPGASQHDIGPAAGQQEKR